MFSAYMNMHAKRGRVGYLIHLILITIVTVASAEIIHAWLHHNHHLSGLIIFLAIVCAIFGLSVAMAQTIRRLNDMEWNGLYSILLVFPAAAVAAIAVNGITTDLFRNYWFFIISGGAVLVPLLTKPSRPAR
ncbi:MAG: DUF805 domain-containing protein [Verrucomicrobiota bacterium]